MRLIWYASIVAQIALLWRLQLLRILPVFRVYLLAALVRTALLLTVGLSSRVYDTVWIVTEPVLLALQVGVVVECCRRIGTNYPGLGRVGEIVLWVCSVGAIAACAISISPDLNGADWTRPVLTWTALAKRSLATILPVLLAALLVCIRAVPSHAPRNTLVHARMLAVYFGTSAAGYALIYAHLLDSPTASALMLASVTVCFAVWTVALSSAGEIPPAPSRIATEADIDASGEVLSAHVRAVKSVAQS
jgi:hypothetical protein